MSRTWGVACLAVAALVSSAAVAQEAIAPEEVTVEKALKPGPNIFVVSPNWGGAGAINVFSADDLSYKGDLATGLTGQMFINGSADTAYVASAYAKRITYGPIEAVLQKFDVATLKPLQEVILPSKFAQTAAMQGALQVTADGSRAYVQNATPATSVSVVDLKAGKVLSEIPTPGCWTVIPLTDGSGFSSMCGDGTFLTVKVGKDGKMASKTSSAKIFDVEADPLFIHSQRVKGDLYFVSYKGVLHHLSDKDGVVTAVDSYPFASGVKGDWAPGGYEVMAYSAPYDVMFVAMHSGAKDGSHKDASEEVWAIDVGKKAVLYRSAAKSLTHVAVSPGATPVLYGANGHEGGLYRYEIDPTAKFAAKLTHEIKLKAAGYIVAP